MHNLSFHLDEDNIEDALRDVVIEFNSWRRGASFVKEKQDSVFVNFLKKKIKGRIPWRDLKAIKPSCIQITGTPKGIGKIYIATFSESGVIYSLNQKFKELDYENLYPETEYHFMKQTNRIIDKVLNFKFN